MSRLDDNSGDDTEDDGGDGYIQSRIQVDYNDKAAIQNLLKLYESKNNPFTVAYYQAEDMFPGEALANRGYCVACNSIKKYVIHYHCEMCYKPMCVQHIDEDANCTFIDLNINDGVFNGYVCCSDHLDAFKKRVRGDTRYSDLRSNYILKDGGDGVLRALPKDHSRKYTYVNDDVEVDDMTSSMAKFGVKQRSAHNAKPQLKMPASTKKLIQYRHPRSYRINV
jgi:hypothetical protein